MDNNLIKSNTNSKIDIWLNDNIFKNKQNGIFIECGANDGIRDSISYFYEKNFNWNGILIEPQNILMNKCKQIRSSSNIFIKKALGDKDESLKMLIPETNLDNASFAMSDDHLNSLKMFFVLPHILLSFHYYY